MALSRGWGINVNSNNKTLMTEGLTFMCQVLCQVSYILSNAAWWLHQSRWSTGSFTLFFLLFFSLPSSLSQVGPKGAVSGPVGGLCLLCSIFPSSVGHLESPTLPRKRKFLPYPVQIPCPTEQLHFCPQPGFWPLFSHRAPAPGTSFLQGT